VNLPGHHQIQNAATAIKAVEILIKGGIRIPKDAIAEGIANNFVPGRIEVINQTPAIILDSSHNVESIMALKNYLEQQNKRRMTLVFGVLRDKNFRRMIEMLLPFTEQIILTEPISKRAYPAESLVKYFVNKTTIIKKNLSEALESARQGNREILITGSFYMVGEIRNLIFGGI
jgi:dihydrofolate synthase/folylpolyglutamate synthase